MCVSMQSILQNCLHISRVFPVANLCPHGAYLFQQVRFKRSKKRKMVHRSMTDVRREATGFAPGPSLGSIIGNPESPYTISRNIKHHLSRLTAFDNTHIRRKKDFGRYMFHKIVDARLVDTHIGDTETHISGLTNLQNSATLGFTSRFEFPHAFSYTVRWGPPSVSETQLSAVVVSFRVDDLRLSQTEIDLLLEIVGPERFDVKTRVVCISADLFPEINHNSAFLGDCVEHLIRIVKQTTHTSEAIV